VLGTAGESSEFWLSFPFSTTSRLYNLLPKAIPAEYFLAGKKGRREDMRLNLEKTRSYSFYGMPFVLRKALRQPDFRRVHCPPLAGGGLPL